MVVWSVKANLGEAKHDLRRENSLSKPLSPTGTPRSLMAPVPKSTPGTPKHSPREDEAKGGALSLQQVPGLLQGLPGPNYKYYKIL